MSFFFVLCTLKTKQVLFSVSTLFISILLTIERVACPSLSYTPHIDYFRNTTSYRHFLSSHPVFLYSTISDHLYTNSVLPSRRRRQRRFPEPTKCVQDKKRRKRGLRITFGAVVGNSRMMVVRR